MQQQHIPATFCSGIFHEPNLYQYLYIAFGTLANRLEAQDLIERTAGEGRRVEHRLTPAGKKLLAAGQTVAAKVAARAFAQLSKAEVARLHELLLRVGEVVE